MRVNLSLVLEDIIPFSSAGVDTKSA